MKKLIAILALTAAVATPALASDGSETVMHSQTQPSYATMSDSTGSFAFAPRANWQNTNANWQNANMNNGQWQAQSPIIDR